MGLERVLQEAAVAVAAALLAHVAAASAAPAAPPAHPTPGKLRHERVAVIDLGPSADSAERTSARARLAAAVVAAGLEPVLGDGVEDALAGGVVDKDALALAAALAEAQRAFGALECPAAIAAGKQAAGIAAARQAAGLPAPELSRAWTYVLLCADREGDADAALAAAARLRAVGGSAEVPADVPGAAIWVDHRPAGTAPLVARLLPGEHVIAAAAGSRRGWAAGVAVRAQARLEIPTAEQASAASEIGRRVAAWRGETPPPEELGWVLARVHARVALVRRGDSVEAWGRVGLAEKPHRLGGEDARVPLAEAERVLALVVERVQAWNDRAPDPDRPLLVEDPRERAVRRREEPTRWWIYAAIAGAVGASAAIVLVHDLGSDRQRVELHYP